MTQPPPLFWFDAHLDLAFMAQAGRDMLCTNPAIAGGEDAPGCITLPSLQTAGVKWAVATIFTETNAPHMPYGYGQWSDIAGARAAGLAQLCQYQQWENDGLVRIIKNAGDLNHTPAVTDPLQIIILMEGADPIADNDDAAWWFEQGVRIVTLCWTHGSRYAAGNGMPSAKGGLTDAGKSLVHQLDTLGVIHDLTHLNDAAAEQLLQLTGGSDKTPDPKTGQMTGKGVNKLIATHSASRTMQAGALATVDGVDSATVAQRHITDELLGHVRDRGGMVGLPLYAKFLNAPNEDRPSVSRTADHVNYLADKLTCNQAHGRTRVGLGSDFDGGFSANDTPVGLEGPTKLAALAQQLAAHGWSDDDIRAMACENWLRYFQRALPG